MGNGTGVGSSNSIQVTFIEMPLWKALSTLLWVKIVRHTGLSHWVAVSIEEVFLLIQRYACSITDTGTESETEKFKFQASLLRIYMERFKGKNQ